MNARDLEVYISVDQYGDGYLHIKNQKKDKEFQFELPFDIAENLAFALSHFAYVELEDEDWNNSPVINGRYKDK